MIAQRVGFTFTDMDEELEKGFKTTIDAWVAAHGWEAFRREESALLERLSNTSGMVLATGGGVVLSPENRRRLRGGFVAVLLTAPPDIILSRLALDPKTAANRPPLTDLSPSEEVVRLLDMRAPLYRETADFEIEVGGLAPETVADIVEAKIRALLR